jgi:hypothetical protein
MLIDISFLSNFVLPLKSSNDNLISSDYDYDYEHEHEENISERVEVGI